MPTDDKSKTGQGNEGNGEGEGTPDPSAIANAAASAHLKRFIDKQLPGILEATFKPLAEKIEALTKAPAQTAPPPAGETDKSKPSPEFVAMQQKLADMEKNAAAAEERRLATEKKAREDRAYSEFKDELSKGGIRPEMLDMVASYLFDKQKLVEVAEDGVSTFKSTRMVYGQPEDVSLPVKDGVASWLKGDAAKPFLPAPGVSNASPVKKNGTNLPPLPVDFDPAKASPTQRIQRADQLEALAKAKLAERGINT